MSDEKQLNREWREELVALGEAGLRRQLRHVHGPQGREIQLDGQRVVNLSSNNYLGLANHAEVVQAMVASAREVGVGAAGSRLIGGTMAEHEALELELAAWHGTEAALLFNSGYQANVGALQALTDSRDEIFSDELIHASLIDGCRLSRATVKIFPHGNMEQLASLLSASTARRKLVVSDSVFSMDGVVADVSSLNDLCEKNHASLFLDEAHAVGVYGSGGRGIAAEQDVQPEILVGTLGKAFGTFGAYVAGSRALIELLMNRARAFVFTTALPPAVVAASRASLELVHGRDGEGSRRRLSLRIAELAAGLRGLGLLQPNAGQTAIFPILVGDAGRTMECSELLLKAGLYVQGIRPPTVPRGTSRLRVALMATHRCADIQALLAALRDLQKAGALPVSN